MGRLETIRFMIEVLDCYKKTCDLRNKEKSEPQHYADSETPAKVLEEFRSMYEQELALRPPLGHAKSSPAKAL